MEVKTRAETSSLRHQLLGLLEADPRHEGRILAEFERRRSEGEKHPLHSSVLYTLTHLSFPEVEAERHWRRIRAHREQLKRELRRDPGLRVAVLDYFVNVSRELKNPKVIEISIFEKTERSAITDGLTGLFNHRHFVQTLRQEIARARRHRSRVSLALFDLDDFKKLNDTKGHPEGDKVLMRAAGIIREGVREIDLAARYGGEEFAVILPETSRTGAYVVADRVRQKIERHFRNARGIQTTISGGVAAFPDDANSLADLVKQADLGLYRAKAAGKNRITMVGGERRRHPRQPAGERATLGGEGNTASAALAKNLSAGGVLLRLKKPVKVGSVVSVVLREKDAPPVNVRGHVVRVSPAVGRSRGGYEVGVRFVGRKKRPAAKAKPRQKKPA